MSQDGGVRAGVSVVIKSGDAFSVSTRTDSNRKLRGYQHSDAV